MLSTTFARSTRCIRAPTLHLRAPTFPLQASRRISTLDSNPHIYVHSHPIDTATSILTLLPTTPPSQKLAIGTCTSLPLTPQNFTPNPAFLRILSSVYAQHATSDPDVISQAAVFGSPGGFNLSQGGSSSSPDEEGGSAGHGGFIHVSDTRNPPDYGRIAWPEDIIGSVEVGGDGRFADGHGRWQDSGTYRVVTREGVLGLTEYMRGKVVERLRAMEGAQ